MSKHSTRWMQLICALAGVAFLCGCAALADSAPTEVGMSRNGTSCTLVTGDPLIVELDANPTTGYLWELTDDQGECLVLADEPSFEPLSEMVGSGGTQRFMLRAEQPGQQTLQLVYHRPWESKAAPAKTFAMNVTVQ